MTDPRPHTTVTYPAIPRPLKTAWRTITEKVTPTPPQPETEFEAAGEVWAGEGPPSAEVVAGMEPGDIYVNTTSGDVFRLDP